MHLLITIALPVLVFILIIIGFLFVPIRYVISQPTKWGVRFYNDPNTTLSSSINSDDTNALPFDITIDDGPSPYSYMIERVLLKHKVKAHWFLIGESVQKYKGITKKLRDAGHLLQNHDFTNRISALVNTDELMASIHKTDATIGTDTELFRPGCGVFTPWMLQGLIRLKKQCVLGDVYAHDPFWSHFPLGLSVPILVSHAVRMLQPGSILILHDGTERRCRQTAEVLDQVLTLFAKNGNKLPL